MDVCAHYLLDQTSNSYCTVNIRLSSAEHQDIRVALYKSNAARHMERSINPDSALSEDCDAAAL